MPRFKLVFFAPPAATQPVSQRLFAAVPHHVGRVGAYAGCAFVSRGTGQFVPQQGARPASGAVGVPERRVEVLVRTDIAGAGGETVGVAAVVGVLKEAHPYEEVAYEVYRLEEF